MIISEQRRGNGDRRLTRNNEKNERKTGKIKNFEKTKWIFFLQLDEGGEYVFNK